METLYYSTNDAASATPVVPTVYLEPQQQIVVSSYCTYAEPSQQPMPFISHWDECRFDALMLDINMESILSPVGPSVSGSVGCHHHCPQPPTAVSPTATCTQRSQSPSPCVKEKKANSVSRKRAKQNERDTSKRINDRRAFENFMEVFGPQSEPDDSMQLPLTMVEKAEYLKHLSQTLFETYEGWPQEKRKSIDRFLQEILAMFNKLQFEADMKRRKSKTCKQRWPHKRDVWCRHCVANGKKACLIKNGLVCEHHQSPES